MKTTISKSITIRKRGADYESLEVHVGYSEEVEHENDEQLKQRIVELNTIMNTEAKKSHDYLLRRYWNKEVDE